MGAACSRCCSCLACCDDCCDGDDTGQYAGLNWVKHSKTFPRSRGGGRFKLRAAPVSNHEIIVRWYKTGRKLSRFNVWIAQQYSFDSRFQYVEPPPERTMISFVGLKPDTEYVVKFCNREGYAWSEYLQVRTKDGPDQSRPYPGCPGLFVECIKRRRDQYNATAAEIWGRRDRKQNPLGNLSGSDYEPNAHVRDQDANGAVQGDQEAEDRPLLADDVKHITYT